MKLHRIPGTDLKLSAFCQTAAHFGTTVCGDAMRRLYDNFRQAGGNFFDTAHCYCFWLENGHGTSERALGECIRAQNDRANLIITTKGGHPAVEPRYPRPPAYLSPAVIASDIQESLDRLGVDQIDLYFLHRDDPRLPVSEIIDTLNAQKNIRYLGASNWSTARIDEANQYAAKKNLKGFVISQPQWNLAHPNPLPDPTMRFLTDADLDCHKRTQLPVVAYSPTACGYFASNGEKGKRAFDNPTSRARLRKIQELAGKLNVTPNQIALAWLMSHPFPVIPILGTANLDHQADALASESLKLEPEAIVG